MKPVPFRRVLVALVVITTTLGVLASSWLMSNARQQVPVLLAEQFVNHLHAGEFSQALELTTRSPSVGKTSVELERIAGRELCGQASQVVGTHPPQTNGNRVRRRISGSEVEMPEVSVEFEGGCLLRVTLRHLQGDRWQVYSFASHAG